MSGFTRHDARLLLATLQGLTPSIRRGVLKGLPVGAWRIIVEEWWWGAHGGQMEPFEEWRVWAIVAGRGFGKTRAGAEWIWSRARENPEARIALVAASLDEVAKVMVDGESGLLALARCDERPRWLSSRGTLHFPSGASAFAYTAERPAKLRGPQHHYAWADELAKWPHGKETWANLMLGLRLGERPRTIVTTTPRTGPLLKGVLAANKVAQTHGRTDQNPHLPADYVEAMTELFGGTRLGRQELEGVLFDELAGALWTREMLEKSRTPQILPGTGRGTAGQSPVVEGSHLSDQQGASGEVGPLHHAASRRGPTPRSGEDLVRIVIGVDPPASATGDACGILVSGLARDGIAYVLADLTVSGLRPEGWARRVAAAAEVWDAQRIVAEKNQGGDMIESVLRGVDANLPVKLVSATAAKSARAEPIALHFETGRARLAGSFPELEDELCAMTYAGFQGQGRSPDRADAMVWAMTELFARRPEPSIRSL